MNIKRGDLIKKGGVLYGMQETCIRGGGSRSIGSRSVPTPLTLEVYRIDCRVDLKNHPISEVLDDKL